MRPVKDRALGPLVSSPVGRIAPAAFTIGGLVLTVGAALAAWAGSPLLAVALFWLGRIADGLDGLVARSTARSSDFGGLLDIVADTVGYAIVPLGIAAGSGEQGTWIAVAVLVSTFYVNVASWAFAAALSEKRRASGSGGPGWAGSTGSTGSNGTAGPSASAGAAARVTSVPLPRGLVEGTETIVFFTVALAFPSIAAPVFWVMAAAVAVTAGERLGRVRRVLR